MKQIYKIKIFVIFKSHNTAKGQSFCFSVLLVAYLHPSHLMHTVLAMKIRAGMSHDDSHKAHTWYRFECSLCSSYSFGVAPLCRNLTETNEAK